jgi:hypothetical protein
MGPGVSRIGTSYDPFEDGADPNDVAEAADSAAVLDDVDGALLREVAAARKIVGGLNADLIVVDYSTKLRMYGLKPGGANGSEQAG